MHKDKIHLLDPIIYNNKAKIFDVKFNPINNDCGIVDISGKLRIIKVNEEDLIVNRIKNFKISNDSIHTLDYSTDQFHEQ
jgi:hypothetical protein